MSSMEKECREGDLSKTRSKTNGAAQEEIKAKMEEENREQSKEESRKVSNSTNSVSFEVPQKNESLEGSRERSGSNGSAKSPGTSNVSSKKVVVVRSAPITIGKVVGAANFINFAPFSNRERTFAQITLRDFVQMEQNAFAQMRIFLFRLRKNARTRLVLPQWFHQSLKMKRKSSPTLSVPGAVDIRLEKRNLKNEKDTRE